MKPYADVLIAWAQGKVVQYRWKDTHSTGGWCDYDGLVEPPNITSAHYTWQVKPEPKPDVVEYMRYFAGDAYESLAEALDSPINKPKAIIKITTNGETGKVTAEVCE